jgi:hypothetical protein
MSPILIAVALLAVALAVCCFWAVGRQVFRGQSGPVCRCPVWRREPGPGWWPAGGSHLCPHCKGVRPAALVPSWRNAAT